MLCIAKCYTMANRKKNHSISYYFWIWINEINQKTIRLSCAVCAQRTNVRPSNNGITLPRSRWKIEGKEKNSQAARIQQMHLATCRTLTHTHIRRPGEWTLLVVSRWLLTLTSANCNVIHELIDIRYNLLLICFQ